MLSGFVMLEKLFTDFPFRYTQIFMKVPFYGRALFSALFSLGQKLIQRMLLRPFHLDLFRDQKIHSINFFRKMTVFPQKCQVHILQTDCMVLRSPPAFLCICYMQFLQPLYCGVKPHLEATLTNRIFFPSERFKIYILPFQAGNADRIQIHFPFHFLCICRCQPTKNGGQPIFFHSFFLYEQFKKILVQNKYYNLFLQEQRFLMVFIRKTPTMIRFFREKQNLSSYKLNTTSSCAKRWKPVE